MSYMFNLFILIIFVDLTTMFTEILKPSRKNQASIITFTFKSKLNYFISFILQSTLALGSEEPAYVVFYQVLRYLRPTPINRTTHNIIIPSFVVNLKLLQLLY